MTGSNNVRVFCETEVVIATEHNDAVPFHLYDRCLSGLEHMEIGINVFAAAQLKQGDTGRTFVKQIHNDTSINRLSNKKPV